MLKNSKKNMDTRDMGDMENNKRNFWEMKNKTHEIRNLLDGTNKRLDTEEEKNQWPWAIPIKIVKLNDRKKNDWKQNKRPLMTYETMLKDLIYVKLGLQNTCVYERVRCKKAI